MRFGWRRATGFEKSSLSPAGDTLLAARNGKGMTQLVRGVTRETYQKLGKQFIASNDNIGFVIARRRVTKGDTQYPPTLQQWGAWRSYFQGKGISTRFMETRDYYTVPTEWPHQFDADAPVSADYAIGDEFYSRHHRERARLKDAAAQKAPLNYHQVQP